MSPGMQQRVAPMRGGGMASPGGMPPGFGRGNQGTEKKKVSLPNWLIILAIIVFLGGVGLVLWLT